MNWSTKGLIATEEELCTSWWPWKMMELVEEGKTGVFVLPERATWADLVKVKALILTNLTRAVRRGWADSEAYHTQHLQCLVRIEEHLGPLLQADPALRLGEASALWLEQRQHQGGSAPA